MPFETFDECLGLAVEAKSCALFEYQLRLNEARRTNLLAFGIHEPMLHPLRKASLLLIVVNLNTLLKGSKAEHSMSLLLDLCKANTHTPGVIIQECRDKLAGLKKHHKAIGILRGEVFGHRILKHSAEHSFRLAKLNLAAVNEMADGVLWIIEKLAEWADAKGDALQRIHNMTDIPSSADLMLKLLSENI